MKYEPISTEVSDELYYKLKAINDAVLKITGDNLMRECIDFLDSECPAHLVEENVLLRDDFLSSFEEIADFIDVLENLRKENSEEEESNEQSESEWKDEMRSDYYSTQL